MTNQSIKTFFPLDLLEGLYELELKSLRKTKGISNEKVAKVREIVAQY